MVWSASSSSTSEAGAVLSTQVESYLAWMNHTPSTVMSRRRRTPGGAAAAQPLDAVGAATPEHVGAEGSAVVEGPQEQLAMR